jgi:hypothetical protein
MTNPVKQKIRSCLTARDYDAIVTYSHDERRVWKSLRSFLYELDDNLKWPAIEAIGAEIICLIPELGDPYGTMVIDRTLEEPPLVQGGLWAIGRQGRRLEGRMEPFEGMILDTFNSSDTQTLGLAAWAAGESRFSPALPCLEPLKDRLETVRIFIRGVFLDKPLGVWAEHALTLLQSN